MNITTTLAPKQVLLRLPEDIAARLSRAVPARKRNQFLVDLLRRELDKEDAELVASAEYMNGLEAKDAALAQESQEWLDARLADEADDGFDRSAFERDFSQAQAAMNAAPATGASRKTAARK